MSGIGLGLGIVWRNRVGGIALLPEMDDYIDGLTTDLSDSQLNLLNELVGTIDDGLSIPLLTNAFDVMYILANETAEAGLRNLVKRAHDADAVNSPTFTALEGFTGDGSTAYLDSNYNSSTEGDNYTRNSASFGVYVRNSIAANTGTFMGCKIDDNSVLNQFYDNNATELLYRINTTPDVLKEETKEPGFFIVSRTASNAIAGYNNKAKVTETQASSGLVNCNFGILARITTAGVDQYSLRQASFAFTGKGLNDTEEGVIEDAFETYMDANGTGVIS